MRVLELVLVLPQVFVPVLVCELLQVLVTQASSEHQARIGREYRWHATCSSRRGRNAGCTRLAKPAQAESDSTRAINFGIGPRSYSCRSEVLGPTFVGERQLLEEPLPVLEGAEDISRA